MREPVESECQVCGTSILVIPIAGIVNGLCDACQKASEPVHRPTRVAWEVLACNFRTYLDTRLELLPCQIQSKRVICWNSRTGLNMWGPTATGKTRSLLLLLRRLYESGSSVRLFGPEDFAAAITKHGFKAALWIQELRRFDILGFDDLGKVKLTPIQEGHLFGLLESFTAAGKPVFVTHNFNGRDLAKRFREGDPIVTRLRNHCTSIYFPAASRSASAKT